MTLFVNPGFAGDKQAVRIAKDIEIVIRGAKDDQFSMLHQPYSKLDVEFDPPNQVVTIIETTKDRRMPSVTHTVIVRFDKSNSRFLKLDKLPDGSVLVTFEVLDFVNVQNERVLRVEHIYHGFDSCRLKNPLDEELIMCNWSSKQLQVLFPASKFFTKETEAVVLLTFDSISLDQYFLMQPDYVRPAVPAPAPAPRVRFVEAAKPDAAVVTNGGIGVCHVPGAAGWSLEEGILSRLMSDDGKASKKLTDK